MSKFICLSFLILSIFVNFVKCYITRLNGCQHYANFSIIKEDTFFDGVIIQVVEKKTKEDCALACLLYSPACMYVNYHSINSTCKLQKRESPYFPPSLTLNLVGWIFMSPNYETNKRGPVCNREDPCMEDEVCYDECNQQGYICTPYINIMHECTFVGTEFARLPSNAIDGDYDTSFYAKSGMGAYIGIDMIFNRGIEYIETKLGGSHGMYIRIGNSNSQIGNDICFFQEITTNNVNRKYHCSNGKMFGRYIVFHKPDLTGRPYLYEVKVFVKGG